MNKTDQDLLTDTYGRTIKGLRISITNRCNLDCIYCHNEGDTGHGKEMSVETISNLVNVAARFGVNKVKFSGGEPLVRRDFEDIISSLPPLKDISVTTNGTLLSGRAQDLKDAGLDRVNVSLDTLDPDKYQWITNTKPTRLDDVLDGIHSAIDADLTPVKLNVVMLRGINDTQLEDMLEFTKEYNGDVILQLIQLMDVKDVSQYQVDADAIEQGLAKRADEIRVRQMHHRKKYTIDGAEVEFVRPVDNTEFCANCNRLRVTADGNLKPCLLVNDNLVDVSNASLEELPDLFKLAVHKRVPYCREV